MREGILDNNSSAPKRVLGKTSNATMAAFSYGMLFVALMLFSGGTVTINGLGLPAIALYGVVSLVEYFVGKGSETPRWLVIGSFISAVVTAAIMTTILH
ncbi:hypothetical protein ABFG93_22905 (plasmid) [Pseudalkalibacillus hwajinpoensis]|uniref:hypothetical protein n=1 Tax=Guptibacillus hwajinpoensis TaxID=208199 RepID=UPI00325A890E